MERDYEEQLKIWRNPPPVQCTDQNQEYQRQKVQWDHKVKLYDQCLVKREEAVRKFEQAHRGWEGDKMAWEKEQTWATVQGAEHYLHYKFLNQVSPLRVLCGRGSGAYAF